MQCVVHIWHMSPSRFIFYDTKYVIQSSFFVQLSRIVELILLFVPNGEHTPDFILDIPFVTDVLCTDVCKNLTIKKRQ